MSPRQPSRRDIGESSDIWDCELPSSERRGLYVAISGNTAAGKSSLISQVASRLGERGLDAVGVSERVFHHQYLRLMFSRASDFAFPIQVSFMLNRYMILLRNLVELGRIVVIERSHLEDALFVEEHVAAGAIDAKQEHAYRELAEVLLARIPVPDVVVLMNPSPDLSIRRLGLAETRGERPLEFPTEEDKSAWVHRWYELYESLHEEWRNSTGPGQLFESTVLVNADPESEPAANVALVLREIDRRQA